MVGINVLSENKIAKLLTLLNTAKEIRGKTKFHKLIFLGEQEENINFGFKFEKYNYGPYSFDLTRALETLANLGMIEISVTMFDSTGNGGFQTKQFTYSLTKLGRENLEKMGVDGSDDKKIKILVDKWNTLSREKIIDHVYERYM